MSKKARIRIFTSYPLQAVSVSLVCAPPMESQSRPASFVSKVGLCDSPVTLIVVYDLIINRFKDRLHLQDHWVPIRFNQHPVKGSQFLFTAGNTVRLMASPFNAFLLNALTMRVC